MIGMVFHHLLIEQAVKWSLGEETVEHGSTIKDSGVNIVRGDKKSAASVAASDLHIIYVISDTLGHSDVRPTKR